MPTAYIEIQRFVLQKYYQGFQFSEKHFANCYVLHEIPLFKDNLFHCVVINCSFLGVKGILCMRLGRGVDI